jgi:cob(I)alamin adenosyltransferase
MHDDSGQIHVLTFSERYFPTPVISGALHQAAQGRKVLLVQLLKGGIAQDLDRPRTLAQNLHWIRPDIARIIDCYFDDAEREAIQALWNHIEAHKSKYNLLLLDEIGLAVSLGLITEDQLLKLLKEKPPHQEITLIGQKIPDSVRSLASQWSEISRPSRLELAA